MHYQQEIENRSSLENVFCSVGVKMPSVELVSGESRFWAQATILLECLFSGVAQKISFEVKAGTMPIDEETKLHASVFGKNDVMEFLVGLARLPYKYAQNEDNSWSNEAEIAIKPLAPEESHVVDILLCLAIDRVNYSANQALKVQHKIQIKWGDQTWTFPLNFASIMSLKTMTSLLEDR